jgi:hypothetical protein
LAVADLEKKQVVRASIQYRPIKDEYGEISKTTSINFEYVVFGCCPVGIVINHDPVTNSTKYTLTYVSAASAGEFKIGPSSLKELTAGLELEGLIHYKYRAEDALNIIVSAFKIIGKAKYTSEIEKPGFYLSNDGSITCSKRNFVKPND